MAATLLFVFAFQRAVPVAAVVFVLFRRRVFPERLIAALPQPNPILPIERSAPRVSDVLLPKPAVTARLSVPLKLGRVLLFQFVAVPQLVSAPPPPSQVVWAMTRGLAERAHAISQKKSARVRDFRTGKLLFFGCGRAMAGWFKPSQSEHGRIFFIGRG